MSVALRKEQRYIYADYLQWPNDPRYELRDAPPIGVLAGVSIAWDALVARLTKPEH